MALQTGSQLGVYQIGDVIGEGGMGQVYLATDTTLERKVAIKVLPESFASDADRVGRFDREALTLASLNHPNIAQIYGLEKQGDTVGIVMELVEGPTLADRIAEGPIPPEEALRIARQIIDGLEAAHEKGIVHRDLKPANIKVKADGLVKILDFGIAKPIDIMGSSRGGVTPTMVTPAVTETGVIMGTAAYMSPEQAQGKFVDQRTDIWAFGCLMYEMLTGQPAFGGENVMVTMARIIAQEADTNSLPAMVSPVVRHTISLCLQKDVKKRFADIRDVRLGISGTLEAGTFAAQDPPRAKLNWWLPLATAVIGALAAVAVTVSLQDPPAAETEVAAIRRSLFNLPAGHAYTQPNIPEVNLAADGSQLAYSANGAVYVRAMDELEPRMLAGTEGDGAVVPVFSPDGRSILYTSNGGTGQFKVVAVEGGTPVPILPTSPNQGYAWSGPNITYGDGNAVREISPTGGAPTLLVEDASDSRPMEPVRIPGTGLVLYERRTGVGNSDSALVVIASVASKEITTLFPGRQPIYVEPGYLVYFEPTLGLIARNFDTSTLAFGSPVVMVSDINYSPGSNGVQFRVAPDGTLLYEKGEIGGSPGEMVFVANESDIELELNLPPSGYSFPDVSPNGTQLALQNENNIYVYALDGNSEPRQLTRDGLSRHPVWSPDGQYITYASRRDGTYRIWRQRADGSGIAEALTEATSEVQEFPAWAPDGRLAFGMASEEGGADIWIQSIPLGSPELLVAGAGDQFALRFSPRGNAMAYTNFASGTAGAAEVMAQPFPPDGSSTRVSPTGEFAVRPVWSADGATLYYQSPGTQDFAAVDITVPGFALRNRRDLPYRGLSTSHRLAVMPDGKLLLTIPQPVESGGTAPRTELVVVENWIEEVRQRVPRN